MTNTIQVVREVVQQCMQRAEREFHVDMSKVTVRFDLKGCAAGMAGWTPRGGYYLRLNTTMIQGSGYNHIVNDTIPHEVAHLVCFMMPHLGSGHNNGWKRVCRHLGGTGETYHKEEVVYAKGRTYEYTCTQG
ncbi:MAG: SprT-like domain-containing protein, partial [Actinobacteria bacterium]|nr:SprT-like domain-containing protein [Actinomycetota bacterium]